MLWHVLCDLRGRIWGFPKIRGTFLGSPKNKDYSILGSILGYLNFGKLPFGTGMLGLWR